MMKNLKKYTYTLCAGRHNTPAKQAIYQEIEDPMNFDKLFMIADEVIPEDCGELTVYVTGFTPAMLAVSSVCVTRGINLVAMHYDNQNRLYRQQTICRFKRCPFCGGDSRGFGQYCPWCGSN